MLSSVYIFIYIHIYTPTYIRVSGKECSRDGSIRYRRVGSRETGAARRGFQPHPWGLHRGAARLRRGFFRGGHGQSLHAAGQLHEHILHVLVCMYMYV
jgi:hypothetical protein